MNRTLVLFGSAALAAAAMTLAPPSRAQTDDAVVERARAAGEVGEQADGYLGIAGAATPEVRAHVDQINIKRRAVYTDLAGQRGVTVSEVAAAAACQLLASRVGPGQKYRDEAGAWRTRAGDAPVALPSYCR